MSRATVLRNLWVAVIVLAIIALPILCWQLTKHDVEQHVIGWFVAGVFVVLTVPISMFGIFLHLHHWCQPELQRLVIRIIWMAPIYSITCWLALRFKDAAIYLNVGRECYEAWVLYSFTFFLIKSLGTEEEVVGLLIEKEPMRHLFPFCFLRKWEMGPEFLSKTKCGVLSFAVVKTLLAILAFVLEGFGEYNEGDLDPQTAYFWVTMINNCSCSWALYCLVQFYQTFKEDLVERGVRPLPKFLCIKLVLFFSFWQSVGIAALVKGGVIKQQEGWTNGYTVASVATGLQDFIICIEMFFAAIWHVYAFSHEEFMDPDQRTHLTFCQKFKTLFDVSDVRRDVYAHVREVGGDVVDGAIVVAKAPVKIAVKTVKGVKKGVKGIIPKSTNKGTYVPPPPVDSDEEDGGGGGGGGGGGYFSNPASHHSRGREGSVNVEPL